MTFFETPRIPDDIAVGSVFGPGYSTAKARNFGGYEASNQNWSMPLHEGDLKMGVRTQEQLDVILAIFHGVAGMHNGIRFKNHYNYDASGAEGTVLQLTGSTWQMYKTLTYGAFATPWKVSKPLAGATISGGGSYSYSTVTGIITHIGSPQVAPTGWVGEFDFPVRFNTDRMLPQWIAFERFDFSLPIIELRL